MAPAITSTPSFGDELMQYSPSFGSRSKDCKPTGASAKNAAPAQKSVHSTKGASGLLRRLDVSRKTESLLAAALVKCFEEGALPSQWRRHQDKEGRPFFWNESTQISMWTHPAEDAMKELVQAGRVVLRAADPAQEARTWSDTWRKEAEESVGQWRWTSAPDGTPYFYHAGTQETSWHDPRQDISLVFELKYHALEGLVTSTLQQRKHHDQHNAEDDSKSVRESSSCPRRGLATKEWMDPVVYGKQLGLAANSEALKLLTPALLLDLHGSYAAWRDPKGRMYFEKMGKDNEKAVVTWEHPLHNLFVELASMLLDAAGSAEAPQVALRRGLRNLREAAARRDGLGEAGPEGASGRVLREVWVQAFPGEPFLAEDPPQDMTKAENCEAQARKAEEECLRLEKELEQQRLVCTEAVEEARAAEEKRALASARRRQEVEARTSAEAQLNEAKAALAEKCKQCGDAEEERAQASARRREESSAREGLQSEVETLKTEVQAWQKRVEDAQLACAAANAQIRDAQEACSRSSAEKEKEAGACKQLEGELLRVVGEVEEQRKRAHEAEEARALAIARMKEETDERLAEKSQEASKQEALQSEISRVAQEVALQRKRADDAEEQRALASARRKEEASACEEHRIKLKLMHDELNKVTAAAETKASSEVQESKEETAAAQARTLVSDIICKWWVQKVETVEKEYNNYFWLHEEIEKEYQIALQSKEVQIGEQRRLSDAAQAALEAVQSEELKVAEETQQLKEKVWDLQNQVEEANKAHALASARRRDEEVGRSKAEAEMQRISVEGTQSAETVRALEEAAQKAEQQLSLMKKRLEDEEAAHQLASARRQEQEKLRLEVETELEGIRADKKQFTEKSQQQEKTAQASEEQLSLVRQQLFDEEQAHQLSSARRQEHEKRCIQVEAELHKVTRELELLRREQQNPKAKAPNAANVVADVDGEEEVYEGDWHESDTHHESESDHMIDADSFIRMSQGASDKSVDKRSGKQLSIEVLRHGRSRTRPPRISPSDALKKNRKNKSGWETASTREPSPGGTEQSRGGSGSSSPDSMLQAEIKSLLRSREEDHRMILELKEEVRRSLGSSQVESMASTPEPHSPGSRSITAEILEEALREEALLIASKSLATFFPADPKSSRRPVSSRRVHVRDASPVPEVPEPQQFPAPPPPASLPVPARKRGPNNVSQKGDPEGSNSCRSASSGAATRTSRQSLDAPGTARTPLSSRRSESTVCLRKAPKHSPEAPRGRNSSCRKGFFESADAASTPTLRQAWVPTAAIGVITPGCGGNPLGGTPRKPALASDADYRKAVSYEKLAHSVEKQNRSSSRAHRPYSAGILKAYPEAAKAIQAVQVI